MAKLRTCQVKWFTYIMQLVNNQAKTQLKIFNIFQHTTQNVSFNFLIQQLVPECLGHTKATRIFIKNEIWHLSSERLLSDRFSNKNMWRIGWNPSGHSAKHAVLKLFPDHLFWWSPAHCQYKSHYSFYFTSNVDLHLR